MQISILACDAAVNFVASLLDAGTPPGRMKFFTGAMPANTTDADAGTLLSTVTFSNPAVGASSGGTGTFNAITVDTDAAATGTIGHWRAYNNAGTVIAQGSVGLSGADINFNTLAVSQHDTLTITSLTWTQPPA